MRKRRLDVRSLLDKQSETGTLPQSSDSAKEMFLLDQYNALREELLRAFDIQFQTLALTLVIAGTFYTLNFQKGTLPTTILIYPVISACLAVFWGGQQGTVIRIGSFILETYEIDWLHLRKYGWEHRVRLHYYNHFSFDVISAAGIFLGTQVIAILLALSQSNFSIPTDLQRVLFLVVDIAGIAVTALALLTRTRYRKDYDLVQQEVNPLATAIPKQATDESPAN